MYVSSSASRSRSPPPPPPRPLDGRPRPLPRDALLPAPASRKACLKAREPPPAARPPPPRLVSLIGSTPGPSDRAEAKKGRVPGRPFGMQGSVEPSLDAAGELLRAAAVRRSVNQLQLHDLPIQCHVGVAPLRSSGLGAVPEYNCRFPQRPAALVVVHIALHNGLKVPEKLLYVVVGDVVIEVGDVPASTKIVHCVTRRPHRSILLCGRSVFSNADNRYLATRIPLKGCRVATSQEIRSKPSSQGLRG
mmetsp:Transcript_11652/g.27681  ORF Transcript_11652/g.27681 Transcript_11652/m.27681 type:complete len:248 (-) Transcript_11652:162-905(-)